MGESPTEAYAKRQHITEQSIQRFAAKTVNHYRGSINGLCRWCVENGFVAANPLEKISRRKVVKKTKRRSASADELRRLMAAAPARALWYEFAVLTGLRVNEIKLITWDDVTLDGDRPGIDVRVETTKAKREATLPLKRTLDSRLRAAKPPFARPTVRVFPTTPTSRTFSRDCERAVIDRGPDARGRKLDRHALRTSFITWVGMTDANEREQKLLARHSPKGITERDYQDFSVFDPWRVIEQLPDLTPTPTERQP